MCAQAGGDGGVVAIRNGVGFVGFDNCTVTNIRVRALPAAAASQSISFRSCMRASARLCVAVLCATLWFRLCFARLPCATGHSALHSPRCRRAPRHHPTCPFRGIGEGGRRRELCAACGVQADTGGLVGISEGTGHVSVVGSTLANITVRAHC